VSCKVRGHKISVVVVDQLVWADGQAPGVVEQFLEVLAVGLGVTARRAAHVLVDVEQALLAVAGFIGDLRHALIAAVHIALDVFAVGVDHQVVVLVLAVVVDHVVSGVGLAAVGDLCVVDAQEQRVVGVQAGVAVFVDALDHVVGRVELIRQALVLRVLADEVAALVIGEGADVAVRALRDKLVHDVVEVIDHLVFVRLGNQVAQRVVLLCGQAVVRWLSR